MPWLVNLRLPSGLGLLDRELRVAEQLLGVLPDAHQGDADRAFDLDFQLRQLERSHQHLLDPLGSLERICDAAAKRDEDAEFVPTSPREHVTGAEGEDQPAGERDQQLVPGETAHRFIDSAEAQHVDDKHCMFEVASDVRASCLDRFGEREAVREARKAVAKHFRAQRPLRLHLDRAIDDAEKASLWTPVSGQRRQFQPEKLRRDALTLLDVELARQVHAVEETLDEIGDRAGLETVGITPVGCGAGRPLDCVHELFVVRRHL